MSFKHDHHFQTRNRVQSALLKILDASLGRLVTSVWPARRDLPLPHDPKRALFIRPGGIGDAALLMPAIQSFQKMFPECVIDVLAERRNKDVFQLSYGLCDVFCYDCFHDWKTLYRRKYDVIVDTEQWHRLSALFSSIVVHGFSIGFGSNDRRKYFNCAVPYDLNSYEAMSFLSLLKPLGLDQPLLPEEPYLSIPEKDDIRVSHLLSDKLGHDFFVVVPGGSRLQKTWGLENFHRLVKLLAKDGLSYIVLGGANDREFADVLADTAGGLSLAGQTTLVESAAVLSHAKVMISNDTGLLHLAVGLATPAVGIFGPSNPKKWGAASKKVRNVKSSADCAPCSRYGYIPKCTSGYICFNDVSVDQVYRQVLDLIDYS